MLVRTLAIGTLTLTLVACTTAADGKDDPGAVALYRSGSRLKARVWSAEGGAKLFTGFSDTTLGVECAPGDAADGKVRCLPIETTRVFFVDASCTQPAALGGPCSTPKYARLADPCGQSEIFEVGAKLEAAQAFNKDASGGCLPAGNQVGLHAVTKLDPAKLVELTPSEAAVGPLTVTQAKSSDGASAVTKLAITASRESCNVQPLSPGEAAGPEACVPAAIGFAAEGPFVDAACTTPAAVSYGGSCPGGAPKTAVSFALGDGECGPARITYHALGEAVASTYSKSGPECAPASPLPGAQKATGYKVGAKLDATTFPALVPQKSGTGRLRAVDLTIAGVVLGQRTTFEDGAVTCVPRPFTDGVTRCVPSATRTVSALDQGNFSDAACTKPLYSHPEKCSAVPAYFVRSEQIACGSKVAKVQKIGAKFEGAKFYFANPGDPTCVPGDTAGRAFYEVGEEVTADAAFARVTEGVE